MRSSFALTLGCGLCLGLLLAALPLGAQMKQVSERQSQYEARLLEGEKWRLLGEWDKAKKVFEDLLDEYPQLDVAHYQLARIYDTLHRRNEALAHIERAVGLAPDNKWYRDAQARLLERARRYEEAAAVYAALRKVNPHVVDWYLREAALHIRGGKLSEAVRVYDLLERLIGINEELARRKHALYLAMNQHKKAERALRELVQAFPDKAAYRYLLAQYYERQGQTAQARKVWQEVLDRWPGDARAQMALASYQLGQSDAYRYLLSLEPAFARTEVALDAKLPKIVPYIEVLANGTDTSLSVPLLRLTDLLTAIHPDEAKAWAAAADVRYCIDDIEGAIARYRRALQADAAAYHLWEQLLTVLAHAGRFEEVVAASEEALELFPNQPALWYFNALGYLETGAADDALASLDNAGFMPMPEPLQARMEVLRGRALLAKHRAEEAGEVLQATAEKWPQLPEAWEALGDWYAAQGQTEQARNAWLKAQALGGHSPSLQKKLEQ